MTVVVDLGCHTHAGYPEDESVHALIDRFEPRYLFGVDPHPGVRERQCEIGRTAVKIARSAAWTHDGEVAYDPHPERPLTASVGVGPQTVRCFNVAPWLDLLGLLGPLVVKMDVEGSEYPLLEHLVETGRDGSVELLLVEWHFPPIAPWDSAIRRDRLLTRLRCKVEPW